MKTIRLLTAILALTTLPCIGATTTAPQSSPLCYPTSTEKSNFVSGVSVLWKELPGANNKSLVRLESGTQATLDLFAAAPSPKEGCEVSTMGTSKAPLLFLTTILHPPAFKALQALAKITTPFLFSHLTRFRVITIGETTFSSFPLLCGLQDTKIRVVTARKTIVSADLAKIVVDDRGAVYASIQEDKERYKAWKLYALSLCQVPDGYQVAITTPSPQTVTSAAKAEITPQLFRDTIAHFDGAEILHGIGRSSPASTK